MHPFSRLPRWREGDPVPVCLGCQIGRKVPLERCPPLTLDTPLVCPTCDRRCAAVATERRDESRAARDAKDRTTVAPFLDRHRVRYRQSDALLAALFADGEMRSAADVARVTGLGIEAVYQMLHRASNHVVRVHGGYRKKLDSPHGES